MECSIRHLMRGRARLHIPALRNRRLGEKLLSWLEAQPGIRSARINFDCASLVMEYDPAHEPFLMALLERFKGASLADIKALCAQANPDAESKKSVLQVSKDSPLALPTISLLMAFSANPVVMAVNVPLMLWNAIPIARRAWKVWSNESRLNIDVLDTLAISASMLQGNPMAGCIVTWLIKLGDWIRDLTAAGQKRAISELLEFQTKTAWLLRDGEVISIPATELKVEDLVIVYPGEMIPVDGEIIDGHATIDQKTITGEGLPVSRGKGEAAFAATVIREGQITVRALRVGSATTAGQIVHLVESAPIGDTRMQNHAERFADRAVHRQTFAGDGLLVDRGVAVDDLAVDRDHLAGIDHHQILDSEVACFDLNDPAVALHPGRPGLELEQLADRAPGTRRRQVADPVAELDQPGDDRAGQRIALRDRGDDGERVEEVDVQPPLAAPHAPGAPCDRHAVPQHERQVDGHYDRIAAESQQQGNARQGQRRLPGEEGRRLWGIGGDRRLLRGLDH